MIALCEVELPRARCRDPPVCGGDIGGADLNHHQGQMAYPSCPTPRRARAGTPPAEV